MMKNRTLKRITDSIAYERRQFDKIWYQDANRPLFFMEPFQISQQYQCKGEIFGGLEIDLVLEGKGDFVYDGKALPISKGNIIFYDCITPHAYKESSANEKLKLLGCHFMLEAILGSGPSMHDSRLHEPFLALRAGASPFLGSNSEIAAELKKAFAIVQKREPDWDLNAWHHIVGALIKLRQRVSKKLSDHLEAYRKNTPDAVSTALNFINRHLTESFSVDELAAYCHVSASKLAHDFTAVMKMPPIAYRNHLRISRAMTLLRSTDKDLFSIASECGFASMSQFHKLFKAYTGKSPAAFRSASIRYSTE